MSAAEPSEATGDELKARSDAARAGGSAKYAEKLRQEHKLPVRRRLELLLDPDVLIEDGLLAHSDEPGYGADGVVTVIGRIEGRTVCVMANDPTVKAGSWGPRTVEKIVRIQETAMRLQVPIFYLVDSAGARITDQVQMFPGRRHAGRIFYQEVQLSGVVPQICLLFGPSAAGGAYIPAFCDVTIMVEDNANQPMHKGGILFVDSADKAARFIWLCDAFNIALLFLADVPGFMIGTAVERQGIIRHGAKLIAAVAEATVPKISVIVRKAYGAGLYAMAGPLTSPTRR